MKSNKNTYNHLDEEQRGIIRDMLYQGYSSRQIGKEIGVSHTTIQREVKRNRVIQKSKNDTNNPALLCANYNVCSVKLSTCDKCVQKSLYCKRCVSVACHKRCKLFEPVLCPDLDKWPYVCRPDCKKEKYCRYQRYAYTPYKAHKQYIKTLAKSRSGAYLSQASLDQLSDAIVPYIKRGFSPYAAVIAQEEKIDVSVRTIYRYLHDDRLDCTLLHLPRATRIKVKDKRKPRNKDRIDRTGREYNDYKKLDKAKRDFVWQIDTVEGKRSDSKGILTIHNPKLEFQLMALIDKIHSLHVIKYLDYIEDLLGSREQFNKIFPRFLPDRGHEFNQFIEMERSNLEVDKKRCDIYYCDPGRADQKGSAEKNHQHLRSILPKGHVSLDVLNNTDVANLCSHVNSYPRESLNGKTPISLAKKLLPHELLNTLGIEEIPLENVILKPSLLPHALI